MQLIIDYFSGFFGIVELTATAFSLLCVWLATKHNQWTWFFGAIGVILFGYLFYEFKLYSDAGLQLLFFLPVQLWGFLTWRNMASESGEANITLSLSTVAIGQIILAIITLAAINGWLMTTKTDASFPYADALTTWMSVFAQILMIRKYWQSWVLWVSMDLIAIGIYLQKELYVTSGLYVVFLVLATMGGIKWYRDWKRGVAQ